MQTGDCGIWSKMKLAMNQWLLKLDHTHNEVYCTASAALVNFQFSTIRDCKENYEAERSDWENKLEKKLKDKT